MDPPAGQSSCAIALRRRVLPMPEGPSTDTLSPLGSSKVRSGQVRSGQVRCGEIKCGEMWCGEVGPEASRVGSIVRDEVR